MKKIKPKTQKELKAEMPHHPSYPSFGLDLEHLPEAKNWEIGKTYRIGLEVKLTGLNLELKGGYEHIRFDITGVEVQKGNKKKSKVPSKRVGRYVE